MARDQEVGVQIHSPRAIPIGAAARTVVRRRPRAPRFQLGGHPSTPVRSVPPNRVCLQLKTGKLQYFLEGLMEQALNRLRQNLAELQS